MTQKYIDRSCWFSWGFLFLSLVVLFGSTPRAQAKSIDSMNALELVQEADLLLKTKKFDEAVPYLQTYLDEFGKNTDFRIVQMAQDVRFKLGKISYINLKSPSDAAVYLGEYVTNRPAADWYEAMKILSVALLENFDYARCVETAEAALAGPTNEITVVQVRDEEEEDETEYKLDKSGNIIVDESAQDNGKEGYTVADKVILKRVLGEAYGALGETEKSIEPFLYVAENDTVAVQRGYAIMRAIEAMVDLQQFDKLTRLIPALYQTDARYDIRVNMAIMSAAATLFNAEKYDQALIMYRMVLPRETLVKFQKLRIIKLKYDAGLITDAELLKALTKAEATELGIEYTLLGQKTLDVTEEVFYDRDETDEGKPPELIQLEQLVDSLLSLKPYEDDVMFRTAYLYDTVNRPWEAVEVFNALWEKSPQTEIGQRAFYQANRILFQTLGRGEQAVEPCYAFLDDHNEGIVPRQVAYILTQYYQRDDQMPLVKRLLPYLNRFVPSTDEQILRYDTELYYMQAIASVVSQEYKKALAGFELVLNRFPGSHQEENATYWHAMTLMFLQEYEKAYSEFEAYLDRFPEGKWVSSANFQMGTCLFGMEEYEKAKERFTTVIEKYPESASYPDACSMRGDILGSEDDEEDAKPGEYKLDLAIADYQEAIRAAEAVFEEAPDRSKKQATYATFQLATAYELLAKAYKKEGDKYYEKIISLVRAYLDFYGADANISRGLYWIGKTRISQGRVDEAAQSYLDAIIKYGSDLKQDGVDYMISDLVAISRRFKAEQREQMLDTIRAELKKTDDLTLQLRLRALLAQLTDTEIEFGKELISELDDLSVAAPPVLSAMSKASSQEKDYSRAKEILDVFKKQFNESEYIRSAYKLRVFDLYKSGDLNQAMDILRETQERYGTEKDTAWAQLMKGDILIQQGKYKEAEDQLLFALSVSQWRGAPYAEATHRLGMAAELAGDPRKAFGLYQRTYFQYKGYADGHWAAQAYLASVRCLKKLGRPEIDIRNTYRAMLFDEYVNDLPEAEVAKEYLGEQQVLEIMGKINAGMATNITVTLDAEAGE